ncbi:MAG TPA: ribosome biogenesis GTPase Der [Bryobacteraceae bacterium]|jgi:GTP-binding protein|nr:ribosome biogenesis GTPase Der [Bryobacteraceae bacterium]
MPQATPTVVIVGRPNVGKSTLFNRITGQRRAIVGDEPGITRDRIHGSAEHDGRRFEVIDTGGIVVDDREYIPGQILRQAEVALESASQIIFLVDGRSEITGADRDLAQMLQRLGKPVTLAVNKADTAAREDLANAFYELGIPDVYPVSAEHATGVDALLDHVTANFPVTPEDSVEDSAGQAEAAPERLEIKVAIIGRPNVGKSTLLNALTGQERAIVSPIAGTTRDAVDEKVEHEGTEFVFIDTAGIRRKGKTHEMAEKLSVVMARRHIRMAHAVLLVMDATEGVVGLDATIAGYAHEGGRAVIICVNKSDELPRSKKQEFEEQIRDKCKFLDYAPVVFISAKTGLGVSKLYSLIKEVYESASKRITTGELNRFVESLQFEDRKIFYVTQASIRPPAFIVFTNKSSPLHFSHERYLVNQIRRRFGFRGTPVLLKTRAKEGKRTRG